MRHTPTTYQELEAQYGPPLAAVLNSSSVVARDRFATPSVLTFAARVEDVYASDVSVSAADQPLSGEAALT